MRTGNILLGTFVIILAIVGAYLVFYFKKHHRLRLWFKPIGVDVPLVDRNYFAFPQNKRLWKNNTFIFFWVFTLVYFLLWIGGYLIVNLLLLVEWNNFFCTSLNHSNFIYSKNSLLSNGTNGGYQLSDSNNHGLSLLLHQYNVKMYLTQVLTKGGTISLNQSVDTQGQIVSQYQNGIALWLHSFVYSNVFLTPMCQFLSFAFPVSILLSYRRDYASFFAPFAICGGLVTILGGVVFDSDQIVTWQFVFYDQQMFFIYHTFLLVVGSMWFTMAHRYSFKRVAICIFLILAYIVYVLIVTRLFEIEYFTTGLTENDLLPGGSYGVVDKVLPNIYPYSAIIMIGCVFLPFIFILINIKNLFQNHYWKKYYKIDSQNFKHDLIDFYHHLRTISLRRK